MTDAAPNTLLPEDELQAALAEIERMSRDDAAAIPDLDDGRGQPAGSDSPSAKPNSAPSRDEQAGTQADAAERDSGGTEHDAARTNIRSAADDETPAAVGDGGETGSQADRKLHFEIGKKAPDHDVAEYEPPSAAPVTAEEILAAQPTTPLRKRIYRAADRALDAVNQPFEWMGEEARRLVGYVALATLVVSILAIALMPLVMPHRDAVVFVQERLVSLEAAQAAQNGGTVIMTSDK